MLVTAWGGGLIINKWIPHGNFIYLITLLTLWLYSFSVNFNSCAQGLINHLIFLLYVRVLLSFKTKSLLLFFTCFEIRVLPITLIVYLYGYQPEKLQSSISLLMYTVVIRLPLLLFIIVHDQLILISSALMALPMTLSFIVKTPIYLLHT